MIEETTFSKCLSPELESRFKHLWCLVGNTPMLELQYVYKGKPGKIYVKCENYNLTGSIKDRMALYILYKAYTNGDIKSNDMIVEATSGNTGIAFSAIGKALGHDVKIIMPNWLSKERIDIIKSMGAEIQLITKEEGGFLGSIRLSEELAAQGGVFLPRQFENEYNAEAHELTTGKEIALQLASKGLVADAFVAGVGTGGTVMGVGKQLKNYNPAVKIHPLEPQESPTLTTGYKVGAHRIQGISDEFIPAIVKLDELDTVVCASDGDSIIMAQKLAGQLGLAVGISSGANVIGAIKLKEELGDDAVVVTLLCDDNKKYLSTDLVKEQPVKEGYISTDLNFSGFQPIARLEKPLFGSNII
ncbi:MULTISPECIES: PLP-dependent cysteine synthase family protein [Sphingobacterium]|uniref:PLP-dependent cysteine synthase family protein n=1 Tax=Sphingobacterium TaxID=28453 RepID=UPI001969AE35|nr:MULTISPECIES: cysteine synthase family protein [unclassified Sphingobacterium]